jgi:hypothetical protein
LRVLKRLEDVVKEVERRPELYVRFSEDIAADTTTGTLDAESGIRLPGMSVNPLNPESWWTRPTVDWVARQLCQYAHLLEQDPKRTAWLVVGRTVGRGPDREPLLKDVTVVDQLDDEILREAEQTYSARFEKQ